MLRTVHGRIVRVGDYTYRDGCRRRRPDACHARRLQTVTRYSSTSIQRTMSHKPQSDEYSRRVNLVIDTIYADLSGDLTLERLASVSGFSPFHFHRIFKSSVGETLSQFVWRGARIERGALLLRTRPTLPVSDVAAIWRDSNHWRRSPGLSSCDSGYHLLAGSATSRNDFVSSARRKARPLSP